jgi:hypothetical protein
MPALSNVMNQQHPQDIIDEINSGNIVVEDFEAPAPKQ